MPKFVWEITARGTWAPQLFHGELPREMTTAENRHRYVVHELSDFHARKTLDVFEHGASALDYLAHVHPAPPRFTGKE